MTLKACVGGQRVCIEWYILVSSHALRNSALELGPKPFTKTYDLPLMPPSALLSYTQFQALQLLLPCLGTSSSHLLIGLTPSCPQTLSQGTSCPEILWLPSSVLYETFSLFPFAFVLVILCSGVSFSVGVPYLGAKLWREDFSFYFTYTYWI